MAIDGKRARFPVNVYLLRGGQAEIAQYIDTGGLGHEALLQIGGETLAALRYGQTKSIPDWLKVLSFMAVEKPEQLEGASISGIVIAPVRDRCFAITFGHGWQKIKLRGVEPNFGIRCVLNMAKENALRAIRRDRVAEDSIQAIEQIPDSDDIYRFGIDVEKDLLRGVKARVDPKLGFGAWVAGADSFKGSIDIDGETLNSYLERCLDLYCREDYKKNFAWIDNISPVRDQDILVDLVKALVEGVRVKQEGYILCVPEFLEWDDFDLFSFEKKRAGQSVCANYLDLSQWVDYVTSTGVEITEDLLMHTYIYAYKQNDAFVRKWPVFDCIHALVKYNNSSYLAHGGHWFELKSSFVDEINKAIAKIEYSSLVLPTTDLVEKEGDYNARAALLSAGKMLLMDKKLIHHGGGKSKFEVCDLMTEDGHLVCVKRWGAASGSLSHLFAQAKNSIILINNDETYRLKVKAYLDKIAPNYSLTWDYICQYTEQAEVVLGVMRGCSKEDLPFFAKLSLVDCHKSLQQMRFKATYLKIDAVAV